MGSRPEYVFCVESANGIQCNSASDNPTNDIIVPTKMPRLRTPVVQLYLGSVELPLAQYTVEGLWNTVYFDEGVRLIVNNDEELCTREFSVLVDGVTVTAIVPILFNPVVDVNLDDPTAPIFTTAFEHGLDLRAYWNWGAPIQLVSTNLTDSSLTQLTAANPNLVVLSATEFQLRNAPGPYPESGGVYGYVHAPPIASPAYLANIVNAALALVAPGEFQVTYNLNTGRFTFQSTARQTGTCTTDPPLKSQSITLLIPTSNCLAALMGFGCGNVPVPTVAPPSDCKTDGVCPVPLLEGGFGYQCFSQIRITPGNYLADGMMSQLNLQWNRFYFDGGLANNPANRPVFVFSAANGAAVQVPIEYGLYTPDTFAEYLQNEMSALDPLGNAYLVTWDMATGLFCFASANGTPFGLEFTDSAETFNPAVIGYDVMSYRGQSRYCSTTPFQVPTAVCCGSSTSARFSSYVFATRNNGHQMRFTIEVNPPRYVASATLTDVGDGIAELTSTGNVLAHGLQPEDAVNVLDTGSGVTYQLRVVEVIDAFRLRAEIAGVSAFVGAVNLPVSFGMADPVTASLLWSDQARPNRLYPRFLGYGNQDALYNGSPPVFVSPYSHDLDPPRSVLLVVDDPNGATHTNHAWGENNIPNVLGKIILYPQFRLERSLPMTMYLAEVVQVTRMHFLFVNPENHTPYQFHGKNWSATINMTVTEAQAEMRCY